MDVCSFVLVDDVDNIHNVMLMYHPKLARQGKGWFNVNRLAAAFGWQIIDGVCVVFYAPAEVQWCPDLVYPDLVDCRDLVD